MFSSNIWMAHHSVMLSSCSFCLPICNHPTVLPSVYRAVFYSVWWEALPGLLLFLCEGWWPSWGLPWLAGVSCLSSQHSSQPGLGWAPSHQRSRVTSQGAFVGVTASDKKVFVLFELLVWMQTAEMGEGSFWPCLLERLNLQRMCWVLTPLGPCECSVLVWTLAFSIRVKYIVCYYHTVKLIFTILCMIYLRFHWTKQASGIEVL